MSTLIISELYDGIQIDQPIKLQRDTALGFIRPWIYKNGTLQDGQFKLTVFQGANELASSTIDYTEINSAIPETYAHGFIRFEFPNLKLHVEEGATETDYTLRFEMVNHTTNTTNYIAMVKRWEEKTYDTFGEGVVDNEAPNDFVEPYGLEIYEYKIGR